MIKFIRHDQNVMKDMENDKRQDSNDNRRNNQNGFYPGSLNSILFQLPARFQQALLQRQSYA